MPNYLGDQDSVTSSTNNGGYTPNTGGDSINPLIKDIVPDVDITRDIGQPLKRMRTGYYSRLDVTNSDPPVLGLAIQAALAAGAVVLQDESAGFGFTPLKVLTITRIMIQKSILPTLPVARTVKIWQEPGTLLHTGIISNANDDGLNWYTDVNWLIPANVAIRYATDVPNGTSIHNTPAAAFSPVFVDFLQSVRGTGYGVYPGNSGLYPAVPLGNFRFTTEPDTAITYNGTPVALLTDLTSGDISLTALQTKTQYQSIPLPNMTAFTDLYASGEFTVQGNSGVGNLLVQGELKCDQKQAIFEAGVDITGGISADNLELPGFPDVDATLTAQGAAITLQADHLNLTNIGTNTHAQIDSNLTSLNSSVGTLQGKTQNITATAGNTTFTGSTSGLSHLNLSNIGTNTHAQIDSTLSTQSANITTLQDKTQYLTAPLTGTAAGGSLFTGPLEVNGTSSPNIANRSTMAASVSTAQFFVTGMGFTPLVSCNITRVILQKSQVGLLTNPRIVKLWLPDPIPAAGGTELFSTTIDNTVSDATTFYKTVSWPVTAGTLYRIGFDVISGDFINTLANPVTFYSPSMTINTRQVYRNPFSSGGYPNVAGAGQNTELGNFWLDAPISALLINGRDPLLSPYLTAVENKTQNQTAVAGTTTFATNVELKGTNTYVLKSSTADFEIERSGVGDILLYNATTANVTTPIVRGLYIGPGTRPVASGGFVQTASSITVFNSTTETSITGTGIGSLTMGANTAVAGSCSIFRIRGAYGTNSNNTVLELRLRGGIGGVGGALIALILPIIQTAAAAGSSWMWDIMFTCRSTVGANNFQISHLVNFNDQVYTSTALATVDTTIANTMTITARWQTLSPNNQVDTNQMITTNYYQPTA